MRRFSTPLCFVALMLCAALVLCAMLPPLPAGADGINYGTPSIALGSGDVYGNSGASTAPASDTTLTALFDRAFGATQGNAIIRGASTWGAASVSSSWSFASGSAIAAASTKFLPCAGASNVSSGAFDGSVSFAAHFNHLYVNSGGVAPTSGQSLTFTLYKNGASTALTAQIAGTNTSANDTSDTIAFSAGDTCSVQVVTSASSSTTMIPGGSVEIDKP